MIFDGIRLAEGAELTFASVPYGPTLPPGTLVGELFFLDTPAPGQLHVYDGTTWQAATYPYTPVNKAGDAMTGYLILNANPTDPLHAATKQYVDAMVGSVSTNLTYTAGTRLLESSTGTDVTLPLVTSGDAGLAPASGGGTSNYLRADGSWAAPPGGGGGGTVTSVTVDGTSGRVTSSGSPITTSGTITLDLASGVATPGTYTSVTVDTYGRVTAGTNPSPSLVAPNYETAVATASQTVFNTTVNTTANGGGKTYLLVFVNGVKQLEGASKAYTVTGANQVTFNVGLALNDDVEFVAFA